MAMTLSRQEECALVARYQAGDEAAADEIVATYAPFLRHRAVVVSRNPRHDLDLDDLQQEGRIGLLAAARKFDPSRERRLVSYAVKRVLHHMVQGARRGGATIRLSDHVHERLDALYRGRVEEEDGDRRVAALIGTESLADLDVASEERSAEDALAGRELLGRLPAALMSLSARERRVLAERYGEEGRTMAEIGREIGISRERVRQIEGEALGKLRKFLERES